jgi:hypothetical protein
MRSIARFCTLLALSACAPDPVSRVESRALAVDPEPKLLSPRAHAAGLLTPDGNVLLCGGVTTSNTDLADCEKLGSGENAWTIGPDFSTLGARERAVLTALPGGSLLMSGGLQLNKDVFLTHSAAVLTSDGSFTAEPALLPRYQHTATVLTNGSTLVVGGINTENIVQPAQLRLANGQWAMGSSSPGNDFDRYLHAATLLSDQNSILITFGATSLKGIQQFSDSALLYDPDLPDAWLHLPPAGDGQRRCEHTATLLPDGSVLVAGGHTDKPVLGARRFVFSTPLGSARSPSGTWEDAGTLSDDGRSGHAAALLDGFVLLIGGKRGGQPLASIDAYNPNTNRWKLLKPLSTTRSGMTVVARNGGLLVIGGFGGIANEQVPQDTVERVRPLRLGEPCDDGASCVSGECVDSVCCDTDCSEACHACNLSDAMGTCSPFTRAQEGECPDELACHLGQCLSACAADADCIPGHFCDGGRCSALRDGGEPCTRDGDCAGAHCSRRVCCDSACAGPCETCDKHGECHPLRAGALPLNDQAPSCALTPSMATACFPHCDGKDGAGCTIPLDKPCDENACVDGRFIDDLFCSASAQCVPKNRPAGAPARSCEPYLCTPDTHQCQDSCAATADCYPGYVCHPRTRECVRVTYENPPMGCSFTGRPASTERDGLALLVVVVSWGAWHQRARSRRARQSRLTVRRKESTGASLVLVLAHSHSQPPVRSSAGPT